MWLTHNQSVNYFLRLQNNKEEESDKTGSSFFEHIVFGFQSDVVDC